MDATTLKASTGRAICHVVLAPTYAALLRKERRWGLLALAVLVGLTAFVISAIPAASTGYRIIGTATALLLVAIAVWWVLPFVRARPEPTYLVFDARIEVGGPAVPWVEGDRRRRALTQRWHEMDVEAERLDIQPLGSFMELSVAPGMARHPPQAALDTIAALRSSDLGEVVLLGLRDVERQLRAADAQGAKFCFTPISGWSGQCEAIGLYLQSG